MKKILIIEDEEAIADLEKDYLELNDFEVKIENNNPLVTYVVSSVIKVRIS